MNGTQILAGIIVIVILLFYFNIQWIRQDIRAINRQLSVLILHKLNDPEFLRLWEQSHITVSGYQQPKTRETYLDGRDSQSDLF